MQQKVENCLNIQYIKIFRMPIKSLSESQIYLNFAKIFQNSWIENIHFLGFSCLQLNCNCATQIMTEASENASSSHISILSTLWYHHFFWHLGKFKKLFFEHYYFLKYINDEKSKTIANQSTDCPSLDIEANLCLLIIGCQYDTGESIYKAKYHESHKRRNQKYQIL